MKNFSVNKKNLYFILLFAVIIFLSSCAKDDYRLFQVKGPVVVTQDNHETKKEVVFENRIMPFDRLNITVYNQTGTQGGQLSSILTSSIGSSNLNTNQSTSILVSPDGKVQLPLVGWIRVQGLTQFEAADKLTKAYAKYLRKPYVSVDIVNHRVFVVGEVRKPGVVQINNGVMTLMEAIAKCGDITDDADRKHIKIIRGNLRNPKMIIVDLTHISAAGISSLFLHPNDIVYVEPRKIKGFNRDLKEITPSFDFLTKLLEPFVSIKVLTK